MSTQLVNYHKSIDISFDYLSNKSNYLVSASQLSLFSIYTWLFNEHLFIFYCSSDKTIHKKTFWLQRQVKYKTMYWFTEEIKVRFINSEKIIISCNPKLNNNLKKKDWLISHENKLSTRRRHHRPLQRGTLFDNRKPELVEDTRFQLHLVSKQPPTAASTKPRLH